MSTRNRRCYDAAFKIRVVLEALPASHP